LSRVEIGRIDTVVVGFGGDVLTFLDWLKYSGVVVFVDGLLFYKNHVLVRFLVVAVLVFFYYLNKKSNNIIIIILKTNFNLY